MANYSTQIAALGDPTRRSIFELIAQRPRSVAELTGEVSVSQSAVSQHLKVLKETNLVKAEPKGASNIYRIDPVGLGQMRAWLDQLWGHALDQFRLEAEKATETQEETKK